MQWKQTIASGGMYSQVLQGPGLKPGLYIGEHFFF